MAFCPIYQLLWPTIYTFYFFIFQYSVPRGYPILNKLPQMQTVEKGRNAVFHCNASGDPEPVIIWFKDGLPIDQKSNPRYRITELGSLVITLATEKDSAEYMCAAQNDKGIAYSGAVQLYVQGNLPFLSFYLSIEWPFKIIIQERRRVVSYENGANNILTG